MPPCCHELWDPLSCCPALEVITGCATVVGVSVQCTCCTCAGAENLGGVAIKPGYLGFPMGVPQIWGVPGAKAGHTRHCCCWKTDDIICHIAIGAETQGTQDPYACGSKETEEAVSWSSYLATTAAWSHHTLSVVDLPGSQLSVWFPHCRPLEVNGATMLTEICFCTP